MSDVMPVIRPGTIMEREGRRFCVRRLLSMTEFEVIDIESGEVAKSSLFDLKNAITLQTPSPRLDLVALDEDDWNLAIERFRFISPLVGLSQRTKSQVREIAKQASVDTATVYRWLERFESTGIVSSLLRRERNDQGKPRTDDQAETIMKLVIRDEFLQEQGLSPTRAYREVQRQCRKEGIAAPHLSTFRRRIRELTPAILATGREGKKSARRFQPIRGSFPGADFPYAVLQIDHTTVDIILVDETHRLPIQRPYITVAIDVFSRMVAGYYISFDPPGTLGTALCIANAILPKEKRLNELEVSYSWPCRGLPRIIHVDNAKEFRGNALKMACQEYGIDLQFRPVKQPNYGGHIERLMGTLMKEIHALPGTTRSRSTDLGNYNPERKAAMTLGEFETWFASLVLGAYHHRIHSDLKMPPITKYEQGIVGDEQHPGTGYPPGPTNEEKLHIDFLPFEMRTIQPYGISMDGIFYQADVLSRWIGAKATESIRAKRKFIVRRDPRDISYLLFFDPEVKQHFRIPYQNPRFPAISLWELHAVQRYLKEQGKKAENQEVIFAAFDEMRRIEDEARTQTKRTRISQAKRYQRRIALDKQASSEAIPQTPSTLIDMDIDDIRPFDDVEEI
ncbi:Mu transposase C-terminal domain-containing protein [Sulfurirhabdus autotrophica]|uniref:Putative transposase n=1 Tax=Sulfurirhabdus autotrophica TaxID=1706046 RepID=A0A4R3Y3T6_9PROT|nr:Mu transposase C-terminal domain-containing protein [Sulfurirhabdus autotrophica]TCV86317.1 putative transposase [Sulfurirhabdus autotrophica]